MRAKVMLVCDRDVMQVDALDLTTSVCESLLVTALTSDWNTRAWTFFEAFRARRTIHLLCKNNSVVSLKQVIEIVHRKGALDIGILALAMPHCLPPLDDRILAKTKHGGSETRQNFQSGYLNVETSANFLSHRPASRPGDDVVIWSLLMSEKTIYHDSETFWKDMQGSAFHLSAVTGEILDTAASVRTGFLVSNAPRLKIKGLGWAPASPTTSLSTLSVTDGLSNFDGGASAQGWVTPDGLVADWWLWRFKNTALGGLPSLQYPRNLERIRKKFLQGYRWGAILCPVEISDSAGDVVHWWDVGGRLRRTIVVVCGTNDAHGSVVERYIWNSTEPRRPVWDLNKNSIDWEWKGVYAWDDSEPLPEWRRAKKFLIV